MFIVSTANSVGAQCYLRDRCIVSAPVKCHEPPLSSPTELAEAFSFPESHTSAENHGYPGGQLKAGSADLYTRTSLLRALLFLPLSLWYSPLFKVLRRKGNAGAIKIIISHFLSLAFLSSQCYPNGYRKYKRYGLKSTSQIQLCLSSGKSLIFNK